MSDLIERLKTEAHDFSFFRIVLLLETYFRRTYGSPNPVDAGKVRFKPDSSIAFPPNDVTAVDEKDGIVSITCAFMGLIGVTSPLPVYFSEYIEINPDTSQPLYDFLTIFNHRIYALFYRAWKKYHFLFNVASDGSDDFTRKIRLLSGLVGTADTKKGRLLAYCGILSSYTRSANGLKAILSDYFDALPVSIAEFEPRWATLRNVQPIGTQTPLGSATILGTSYYDRSGKFKVVVGPLDRVKYETFLPGTQNITDMIEIIDTYLSDPLEYDIEVQLQSIELVPVILGADNSYVGETSSLGRSTEMTDVQAITIKGSAER